MNYKYFLLLLITSVGLHSCLSWDLPAECTEGMPSLSINTETTVSATAGGNTASWSLVNSSGAVVLSQDGSNLSFNSSLLPSGNYIIKAVGRNSCGFKFDLSQVYVKANQLVVNNDIANVTAGSSVTIPVLANDVLNDFPLQRNSISAPSIVLQPTKGTVLVNPDGTLVYQANSNASGTDVFRYQVCLAGESNTCGVGEVRVTIIPSLVQMVSIPGGTFQMGDTRGEGDPDEKPVRNVTLSSFRISKFEVTQAQWQAVMGNNPSFFGSCDDCPVEVVNWYEAIVFCNALSDREGRQRVYAVNGTNVSANWNANGYRLPTEAEWEYAAGGGTINRTRFGNGRDILDASEANFNASNASSYSNAGLFRNRTSIVGSFRSNIFGLHDMSGNVWELCWDWYGSSFQNQAVTNPRGANFGENRVLRGGSWFDEASSLRVADRSFISPETKTYNLGFRVVTQN